MTALTIMGTGPTIDDSTGVLTIGTGGVGGVTRMARKSNIPVGNTAYGSLGTNAVHVAGTIYVSEIEFDYNRTVTGIAVLNGATVGTDNLIFCLYNSAGTLVANTALAGTLSAGADAFQEIALTTPYALTAGKYYVGVQCNGTTAKTRRIAASTFLNLAKSFTGTFGTLTALTVPTTTAADTGPIAYVY